MKFRHLFVLLIIHLFNVNAQQKPSDPLAHTFSIVARDANTGEMAVAVQSHFFAVGSIVAWGEAGAGVVATQSFVNQSFGFRGLQLLKQGKHPQEIMTQFSGEDEAWDFRQLAILDARGQVATHTGKNCIAYAGHANGDNFSVQANIMLNNEVVPAMEQAWKTNDELPLPERMVAVLKAAQLAGGDLRGKQSAALLVVKGEASEEPWKDRVIDLRVDDHPDPIAELERLLSVHKAYAHMDRADKFLEKNMMKEAMQEYNAAMTMFPDNLEMQFWTAVTLANNGDIEKASTMLSAIYKKEDSWKELLKRLPDSGLLNVKEADLARLLE